MKTEFRRDVETKKIQAIAEIDTPSESGKAILFVLETIEKYGYDVERLISAFQLSGSSNPKQILEGLLFNLRKMGLVDISLAFSKEIQSVLPAVTFSNREELLSWLLNQNMLLEQQD